MAKYHYDDQVKVWHDGEYLNSNDARANTATDKTADVVIDLVKRTIFTLKLGN